MSNPPGSGSPAPTSGGGGSSGAPGPRFVAKATLQEAKTYDFVAQRPPTKTTNILEATGHLVKSCLGGGIVSIHESYKACGLWTAVTLTVILGIFVAYCMYILAKSAQRMYGVVQVPKMSYPDLAEATLDTSPFTSMRKYSKCFRYMVDMTITIDLFGSCCVYQVVIARTIKQLVEGTNSVRDEGIRIYIISLMLPCILLCMITSLKYLAPFSIIADVFIVTVAFATVYYGMKAATAPATDFPIFKTAPGLFEFVGVCVFSMEGVGATLAIENSMTNPRKFPVVLLLGMSMVVSMVMVVGFFGYWGFGEAAKSPVTVNFPFEPFPIVLKVFMALMIYVTFALNFWVPFDLVWFYLKQRHEPSKYWFWERVYRTIHVIGITLIAFTFPNVSKFIGVLGSFCLSNMGFIYPAFIELNLDWVDPGLGVLRWRLWKFIFILIFGVLLCIVGTYSNVKELIIEVFFHFPIVLKVFMALMIYVTFALNFWVPFDLVWFYLKQRHEPSKYWFWERVYRTIHVIGITLIAFTFPNVSKFIGVLGSFCLSNMGFIYPAFIELNLDWVDPGLGVLRWRLWKFIFILIFGVLLCIVGTYSNVKELIIEVFFQ